MSSTTPNYSVGNDRFDAEAATWDSKPEVVESSRLCLRTLLHHSPKYVPSLGSASVLEIGCGTGLLTVPLAEHVGSVLALDTAKGMIGMLNAKVATQGLGEKVTAKVKLLENAEDDVLERKKFDLVVSHLVFHHVPDMRQLVAVMLDTLKQGGRVWISDFEDDGPQAEAFHPKDKHAGVERHGLKAQEMEGIMIQAGFKDVEVFESFRMDKEVESGGTQAFPFLAITGVRP
ncbi:Methyltransferase type 11 [Kalmanozyma brasiliensis GHG001]|uniref:Methyltransferase type 11 domain-containing protein n=1 Tax=Kalmanozyma brasiliensis (strain GHG001) TaxID=1365824 RepID=V5E9Z2_KALBG|nr:Methyltransferase type 11 [Kalmanozyma brasiliensis GHG001]EST07171.1 Methyltransferase type 11 [Kalmanozyma brasiliensis GHG001]